jgi:hypothetical protein
LLTDDDDVIAIAHWDTVLVYYYFSKKKITSQKIIFDDKLSNKDAFCPEGTYSKAIQDGVFVTCNGSWLERGIAHEYSSLNNTYTNLGYRFSLADFCSDMKNAITQVGITHVKFDCDQNNI